MAVQVLCPNPRCGASISSAERNLGRAAQCPSCHQDLSVHNAIAGPMEAISGRALSPSTPPVSAPEGSWGLGPGSVLGRYEIIRTIGQGGMGAVYLAHDTQLHRRVALKIPHLTPGAGSEVFERFYREARAAAALDHPNLCPIYDVGQVDGLLYLTMAYIDGRPLSELIRQDKLLPQRQVAGVIRKLARALQEAHDRGVVHRDLKPANILVSRKRDLVIVDFGLVRRDGGGDARLTRSGIIVGTPAYMSPEQVVGHSAAIGPGCDIYSLGVILYEMLTGQLPFEGSAALVLGQIMVAEPEPLSHFRPDVDPLLESICLKAMSKRASDRYASMTDFAQALTEYLRGAEESPALSPSDAAVSTSSHAARVARPTGGETLVAQFFDSIVAQQTLAPGEFAPLVVASPSAMPVAEASKKGPRWLSRRIVSVAAAVSGLVFLLGVVMYVATDHGTVKIELSDPKTNAVVKVDGKTIKVDGLRQPLTLRVGEHKVEVEGDDFVSVGESFAVKRDRETVVPIPLVPRKSVISVVKPASKPDEKRDPPPLTSPISQSAAAAAPKSTDAERRINPDELLTSGWQVPFKKVAPVMDGVIGPDEYGLFLDVAFNDDVNPGRLTIGSVTGADDLRLQATTAYTATDIFFAFRVWDDVVIARPEKQFLPNRNDSIELFVDGDLHSNDFGLRPTPEGSKEGFQLIADTLGNKLTYGEPIHNGDWEASSRPAPGGYVMEFRIPLRLIDTQDGIGEIPAAAGSTIEFNVAITDNDEPSDGQDTYGVLWKERESDFSPVRDGERSWVMKLHLISPPEPEAAGIEPFLQDLGAFKLTEGGRTWNVVMPEHFTKAELAFYRDDPSDLTLNAAWKGHLQINGKDVIRFKKGSDRDLFYFHDYTTAEDYTEKNDYKKIAPSRYLDVTNYLHSGNNTFYYYHEQRPDLEMGVLLRTWHAPVISGAIDPENRDKNRSEMKAQKVDSRSRKNAARVYLCEMDETETFVGDLALGKNGDLGYDPHHGAERRVIISGKAWSKALSMHVSLNGFSYAKYDIGGKYKTFDAVAAVNDSVRAVEWTNGLTQSPLTFFVTGDGRPLWESRPMQKPGDFEHCVIDVTGIRSLELRVSCERAGAAHAVWGDPNVH